MSAPSEPTPAPPRPLEAAIRTILDELSDSGPLGPAMQALGSMENLKEVLDELRRLGASAPEPRIRFQAERILKAVRPPRGIDFGNPAAPKRVVQALRSPDPEIRIQGARALRQVEGEVGYSITLEAIQREEHPWVLATLTSMLGLKGVQDRERATEVGRKLLAHPSPRVGSNALLALLSLAPEEGVAEARKHLDSPDPRMRTSAIMATFTSDPDLAWSHVRTMLESEEIWMRTSGSFLAAKLDHPDSERALLDALTKEEDPTLVLRTLDWFGRSGTEACLERLELIAHLGEAQFREAATQSLEQVRARVQTDAPPDRPVSPAVLESGFHLTGVIPRQSPHLPPVSPSSDGLEAPSSEDILRDLANQQLIPPELPEEASSAPADRGSRLSSMFMVPAAAFLALGILFGTGLLPLPRGVSQALGAALSSLRQAPPPSLPVAGDPDLPSDPEDPEDPDLGEEPTPAPRRILPVPSAPLEVDLRDGRVDLNRQPAAGKMGHWVGTLQKPSGQRLVLETAEGIHLRFLFQEPLEEVPGEGVRVRLVGQVFRKAREGITLAPEARLETLPEDETEP